jgi:hypothetical protein
MTMSETEYSETARQFGEDTERAIAVAKSEDPEKDMTEFVRYKNQGAKFRVVSRDVQGENAVYIEKKRSCDDEWQHEKKLGWELETDA